MPDPVYVPFRAARSGSATTTRACGPYMPMATVLRSAAGLASDVHGLRLVLASTVGGRYRIEVPDDGSEVRLRRWGMKGAGGRLEAGGPRPMRAGGSAALMFV